MQRCGLAGQGVSGEEGDAREIGTQGAGDGVDDGCGSERTVGELEGRGRVVEV